MHKGGCQERVSELPAGTGSLQEVWGTHGWHVSVTKDFLSNRLRSMWDTEGFYSLC